MIAALACSGWAWAQESNKELKHPMDVLERTLSEMDYLGEETKERYREILRERLAAEGRALTLEELSDAAVGDPVDAEALEKAKFATFGLYNGPWDVWRPGTGRYSADDDTVHERYLEGREIVTVLRKRRPPGLSSVVPYESMSQRRKWMLNDFVRGVKTRHEWLKKVGEYSPPIREAAVEGFRMQLYEYFDWPVFEAHNPEEIERQVTEVSRLNAELRGRKFPPEPVFRSGVMTAYSPHDIPREPLLSVMRDDMTPAMKHPLKPEEFDELLRLVREKAEKGEGWSREESVRGIYDKLTIEKHYGHLDPSVFILWAGVPQEEFDAYNDLRYRAHDETVKIRHEKERLRPLAQLAADARRDMDETGLDFLDTLDPFEIDPGGHDAPTPAAQAPDAPTPDAPPTAKPPGPTRRWWTTAAALAALAVVVVVRRVRKRRRSA